jgi:FKBP-type peptidyl-prolyl cis-trans isomerase FkpA
MKRLLLPIVAVLLAAGCGGDDDSGPGLAPTTSAPYSQTDLVVGTGTPAVSGTLITVAYTGWLHDSSRPDAKGTQFDSRTSYEFRLGVGMVIRGWDQGLVGLRIGGQRRLVIPPDLAYGNRSPGAPIPPNATLVFDVTLLNVQP